MVEYEGKRKWMQEHIDTTSYIDYNLKVDSNNIITIKKLKDNYTNQEVTKLLYELSTYLYNEGCTMYPFEIMEDFTNQFINNKL